MSIRTCNRLRLQITENRIIIVSVFGSFASLSFLNNGTNSGEYANSKGIRIIGDIAFLMGFDSVDVWAKRQNYLICANDKPKCVAAAVPDKYSDKVRVWGNPIYDWNNMAKDDFAWWRMRIRVNKELFDIVRINHFAGMVKIYTVPYDKKKAATSGKWIKGPGKKLINAIKEELDGDLAMVDDYTSAGLLPGVKNFSIKQDGSVQRF